MLLRKHPVIFLNSFFCFGTLVFVGISLLTGVSDTFSAKTKAHVGMMGYGMLFVGAFFILPMFWLLFGKDIPQKQIRTTEVTMTDNECVPDKEKKPKTRALIYFGLVFVVVGLLLHFQPNLVIGLPTAHADYAKALELTYVWGRLFFAIGAVALFMIALWWVCDYCEPSYKEVFEDEWRADPVSRVIDQD